MSDLKITDLRDATKPGEIAAKPLTGTAAALEQHMQSKGLGFGQDGSGYSSEISQGVVSINGQMVRGVEASAGAHTVSRFRRAHQQTMMGALAGGDVTSDRPALETLQPGYVPRA